jgi:hypothetical protein
MPWTIPNLVLHDKPVALANMRSQGRNRVFVCCCHHNAELNVSRLCDLQRPPATHALHSVRSSRRRRRPLVAGAVAVLVWVGFAQQVDVANATERHLERGQLECRCSER